MKFNEKGEAILKRRKLSCCKETLKEFVEKLKEELEVDIIDDDVYNPINECPKWMIIEKIDKLIGDLK